MMVEVCSSGWRNRTITAALIVWRSRVSPGWCGGALALTELPAPARPRRALARLLQLEEAARARCAVERTRDHSLRGLGRNGSPPGSAWDGGEAAKGGRGGLDVLRRGLAKRAVECCEMRWASVFPSSGSDDCPPI